MYVRVMSDFDCWGGGGEGLDLGGHRGKNTMTQYKVSHKWAVCRCGYFD